MPAIMSHCAQSRFFTVSERQGNPELRAHLLIADKDACMKSLQLTLENLRIGFSPLFLVSLKRDFSATHKHEIQVHEHEA
jgi:hypothetical protein